MVAADNGDMEMFDLALKSKADVNAADSKGNTPLMIASANDDAEMVKWSIENGAKVNAKGGAKAEKSP
jgi:ankyrin repeat protein